MTDKQRNKSKHSNGEFSEVSAGSLRDMGLHNDNPKRTGNEKRSERGLEGSEGMITDSRRMRDNLDEYG
jgi:hypothetical protein